MKSLLFKTNNNLSPLFLRLFLAIVIFPHGAQKLVGWFGGYGWQGTMNYFTETVGLPPIIGVAVILIEFFGPLAILLVFATGFCIFVMGAVMTGVILTNFTGYFFMNWFGNQKTEGMEFFLLAIGISLSLVVSGAGRFSIDSWLGKKSTQALKETNIALAY
jgi:putative oxidoreductase